MSQTRLREPVNKLANPDLVDKYAIGCSDDTTDDFLHLINVHNFSSPFPRAFADADVFPHFSCFDGKLRYSGAETTGSFIKTA